MSVGTGFLSRLHALNRDNTVCFNVTAPFKVSVIICSIHKTPFKKVFHFLSITANSLPIMSEVMDEGCALITRVLQLLLP